MITCFAFEPIPFHQIVKCVLCCFGCDAHSLGEHQLPLVHMLTMSLGCVFVFDRADAPVFHRACGPVFDRACGPVSDLLMLHVYYQKTETDLLLLEQFLC